MPLLGSDDESKATRNDKREELDVNTSQQGTCQRYYNAAKGKAYEFIMLPYEMYVFTARMSSKFGVPYISILFLLYGVNQGLGQGNY